MYKYIDENKSHLHTLDDKPLIGTSSVLNVISKPLTWWAAETSAVECLEAGEKIPTIREEYLSACSSSDKKSAIDALQKKYPIFKKARFAHFADKNAKADKGTDLHAEVEHYVKAKMGILPMRADYDEKIKPFIDWAEKNVKRFLWSEIYCYSEKYWLGGISDCAFEDNEGKKAIIDFKSSKEAYLSQFLQIAGYSIQLSENGGFTSEGENVLPPIETDYYVVWAFGAEKQEPAINYNVKQLREAFLSALNLYKVLEVK